MFAFSKLAISLTLVWGTSANLLPITGPLPGQIKNLVTFGDSYTDVVVTGDGGVSWPIYAADYGNFDLHPFARAGATCSNNLTFRPFPSLFETQIPLFKAEKANGTLGHLNPLETIYTLWIGTNDVGVNSLVVGQGTTGVTLVDTVTCAVNWISALYKTGARNFLFQNMIPLQHTILYSANSYPNRYWTAQRNTTEWSIFMNEMVTAGNKIAELMLQQLPATHPGAHIGLFDSHTLFTDIIATPGKFLNGTVAPNTTSCIKSCIFKENESTNDAGECTIATGKAVDSFMWFDELHPSEQTDRVVAREVVSAIKRTSSKYVTWFS